MNVCVYTMEERKRVKIAINYFELFYLSEPGGMGKAMKIYGLVM